MRRRLARRSTLYTLVSVMLALAAALAVRAYTARLARAAGTVGPAVPVVVATTAVSRGSALAPSSLTVTALPRAYVPPGSLSRVSQATGRVALTDFAAGEVVTETRLARVRAGPVASLVPQGLRAFAVPTSLPEGTVVPGDHVDVLATYGAGQPHTEVVVMGVEVLLVLGGPDGTGGGRSSDLSLDVAGSGMGPSVTLVLLVSPDQEERLAFARAFADLAVAIAPAEDVGSDIGEEGGVTPGP